MNRSNKNRFWISLITFTVIIAFLCQNIAWAKGPGMLMPDNERFLKEFEKYFTDVKDPCKAWRDFIKGRRPIKESVDKLTESENTRLKKFIEKNKDSLPGCAQIIFSELLGIRFPEPAVHISLTPPSPRGTRVSRSGEGKGEGHPIQVHIEWLDRKMGLSLIINALDSLSVCL